MKVKSKLLFLSILLVILAVLYLTWGLNPNNWDYALPRRIAKVVSILLGRKLYSFFHYIISDHNQ